jgi:hypothetical protein
MLALWVGLWRAGFTATMRLTGLAVTGVLLSWYVVTDLLARSGFDNEHWDVMRPVGWAIATAWLIPLMRSKTIGLALDAIPPW